MAARPRTRARCGAVGRHSAPWSLRKVERGCVLRALGTRGRWYGAEARGLLCDGRPHLVRVCHARVSLEAGPLLPGHILAEVCEGSGRNRLMTAFGELGEHGLWLRLVVALRFLPLYLVALGPRYNKPITPPPQYRHLSPGGDF